MSFLPFWKNKSLPHDRSTLASICGSRAHLLRAESWIGEVDMVVFAFVQGDDLIALAGCVVAFCIAGLILQLVHFIQHRKRPTESTAAKLSEEKLDTSRPQQQRQHDNAA